MPVTTTQIVNCPCCSTGGYCSLCASEESGTGTMHGILSSVLNVTVYNNSWLGGQGSLGVTSTFHPWCDCLNDGLLTSSSSGLQIPPPSAPGSMPPPYYPAADTSGTLNPITFPLTWDPNYVVRDEITNLPNGIVGAWVYRQYNCGAISGGAAWYAFIIKFYCAGSEEGSRARLVMAWYDSSAGFEGSGTGTGTEAQDGDPSTTPAGLIWADAFNGTRTGSHPSYDNSCLPPYFQFGVGDPIFSNDGEFQGTPPDQLLTGNYFNDGGLPPVDKRLCGHTKLSALVTA